MAEQIEHLLALSRLETVSLQVMPLSVPVHDGLDGEFTLLDFDGARSIGYVEFPNGAVYVQNHDQIGGYRTAAARLATAALTEAETIDWLLHRRAELRD